MVAFQDASPIPPAPYVIGLTGCSGSGKSSIAGRLEALGAARIDCDRLGHLVYQAGSAGYHRVLQEFGSGGFCGLGHRCIITAFSSLI